MGIDDGLMKCNERLGHADWVPVFLGWLSGTRNAEVAAELQAAISAAGHEHEVPAWATLAIEGAGRRIELEDDQDLDF